VRGIHGLAFSFKKKLRIVPRRISASESRRRILTVLADAKGPLKKAEILRKTGISTSTWNVRIKELLSQGKVSRSGERRDSVYILR
jgi:predicted transcriptional regulator